MTDKELRKLSRTELLEMLVERSREVERLQEELKQVREQLTSRQIAVDRAGSIAEASLQLNGVFDAAQKAAEQYLENIRQLSGRQTEVCARLEAESQAKAEQLLSETQRKCETLEAETQAKCTRMVQQAETDSKAYWKEVSERVEQILSQQACLQDLLSVLPGGR